MNDTWLDEEVDRVLRTRVPGGSEVWWVINGGGFRIDDGHRAVVKRVLSAFLSQPIKVTDEMVERAAWNLERARRDYWDDDQFEIWWNRDPLFVERATSWGFFAGTPKEKLLWETRIALEAAFQTKVY